MPRKRKVQKIQIRNRKDAEGKISVGANMEVLLDGKRIGGAYAVKFEVNATSIAKVTIELYAEVQIDANVNLSKSKIGQTLIANRHVLSSYAPVVVKSKG